jgi:hypothetical protein
LGAIALPPPTHWEARIGLAATAGNQRSVLHPYRASAPVDLLHLGHFVDEVLVGRNAEDVVGELDLGNLLEIQIHHIELGHGLIPLSSPKTMPRT